MPRELPNPKNKAHKMINNFISKAKILTNNMQRENKWQKQKTPAQIAYWESMKGKRGADTPRWKGSLANKYSMHQYLYANYGKPTYCTNDDCSHKCKIYEWCLKTGREYSHNPRDYLWLCRSCHRNYDLTPEKKKAIVENLKKYNTRYGPNKKTRDAQ